LQAHWAKEDDDAETIAKRIMNEETHHMVNQFGWSEAFPE